MHETIIKDFKNLFLNFILFFNLFIKNSKKNLGSLIININVFFFQFCDVVQVMIIRKFI
jgi:hypothetical protein